ncbi:alpha/beta fold hydrolase [Actinomadura atramentaria]|uniref:alpha/beta fold hydrolase n=1 Tax=Actinomadura atramentaria TaxID=1990 RepID=UPI00037009BA|nr:alpha/beta hydrolase [Actinomadura atramentaria]
MEALRRGTASANGLDFALLETGPADGPLALCLHGFPDTAHTWRHLLPALADAGYRAVAPFQRGYAPTSVPADGAYQTAALATDAVALHDALGGGPDAVLIGHDWGAAAAYGAAALAPDRFRRAVALALPPVGALLTGFLRYEQLKRSFYVFLFQTPLAEAVLVPEFIAALWRDWSPGHDGAADAARAAEALAAPANAAAALGYYRAMLDPARHVDRYKAAQETVERPGTRPVLYLHGADDGCLGAETAEPAAVLPHLPPGSRAEIVADAGHFLHLERPDEIRARVLDWLAS